MRVGFRRERRPLIHDGRLGAIAVRSDVNVNKCDERAGNHVDVLHVPATRVESCVNPGALAPAAVSDREHLTLNIFA